MLPGLVITLEFKLRAILVALVFSGLFFGQIVAAQTNQNLEIKYVLKKGNKYYLIGGPPRKSPSRGHQDPAYGVRVFFGEVGNFEELVVDNADVDTTVSQARMPSRHYRGGAYRRRYMYERKRRHEGDLIINLKDGTTIVLDLRHKYGSRAGPPARYDYVESPNGGVSSLKRINLRKSDCDPALANLKLLR